MEITKGVDLLDFEVGAFLRKKGKEQRAIFFVRNMFFHMYKDKERLKDPAYIRLYHELIEYMMKEDYPQKEPLEYSKYQYHIEAVASVITAHDDYYEKYISDEEIEEFLACRKKLWEILDNR